MFYMQNNFKVRPNIIDCYNNYIYLQIDAGQLPISKLYNRTAKIEIRYEKTLVYFENILATKYQHLLVLNLLKNLRISSELAIAYGFK